MQVILDVVYNHTNEADDAFPYTTSFRGIDNKVISIMPTFSHITILQQLKKIPSEFLSQVVHLSLDFWKH